MGRVAWLAINIEREAALLPQPHHLSNCEASASSSHRVTARQTKFPTARSCSLEGLEQQLVGQQVNRQLLVAERVDAGGAAARGGAHLQFVGGEGRGSESG